MTEPRVAIVDDEPPQRPRWYRGVYRAAYRLRLVVWRRSRPPTGLVALVEGSEAVTPGRALDLGCGTGTDTIYLAAHGWDVTGIDMVPRALTMARRSASEAGVEAAFVHGDVTRLSALGIGQGYDLVLDFGCLHTLPDDLRGRYVQAVSQVAAPGATLLLYGFRRPPRAAPMTAGLAPEEVTRRFAPAGWEVVHVGPAPDADVSPAGRRSRVSFDLWHYRLRRVRSALETSPAVPPSDQHE
ncbi:MAG TPA: class I SAM-dependent methyltransferase [Actinomycetospora sp.]|uniref:class I SAM-dependent methyltransferase n=1 Tax=Actinomycetospora sp. TaxID=1872135 RepID=UPI002F424303